MSDINVVQPDLVFVANEKADILTEKNIAGVYDLIIEIVSPSSAYYDLVEIKDLFNVGSGAMNKPGLGKLWFKKNVYS